MTLTHESTLCSIDRPTSPEELFEHPVMMALESYAEYAPSGERVDIIEHAVRTQRLVRSFAGGDISSEAVTLALLHDVVDRAMMDSSHSKYSPEKTKAASLVLLEFFSNPMLSQEQHEYAACILADLVKTEEESGEHRKAMAKEVLNKDTSKNQASDEEENEENGYEQLCEMISERYEKDIPEEVWKKAQPLLDFDHMRRFMKKINIESFIIKACELIDNIENPTSERESAHLQDVLEAESFYAPIAEVLGYEGLAARLRSCSNIRRLIGQGKDELVEGARRDYEEITKIGEENLVAAIFGGGEENNLIHPAVDSLSVDDEKKPVIMGEFVSILGQNEYIAGNYRVKTEGSIANKSMDKNYRYMMDKFGVMVISDNQDTVAQHFADFVGSRLKAFTPVSAVSKKSPIYIQGNPDYIEKIEGCLRNQGVDSSQYETRIDTEDMAEERGYGIYEVSKVTFIMEYNGIKIPTEVQFLTKAERHRSRLGEVAHIIYKYLNQYASARNQPVDDIPKSVRTKIVENAVEMLEDMYERRKKMIESRGKLGINKRSLGGIDQLAEVIIKNTDYDATD